MPSFLLFRFIFHLPHFSFSSFSAHISLFFSPSRAPADRKCQCRPGYFRPNWEIDVHSGTWHLDMPFIPPCAHPPTQQEPDTLTAYWNVHKCPFWWHFSVSHITRRDGTRFKWTEFNESELLRDQSKSLPSPLRKCGREKSILEWV